MATKQRQPKKQKAKVVQMFFEDLPEYDTPLKPIILTPNSHGKLETSIEAIEHLVEELRIMKRHSISHVLTSDGRIFRKEEHQVPLPPTKGSLPGTTLSEARCKTIWRWVEIEMPTL